MKRGLCCLFLVLGLSAAADSASAQIQSAAFDPNCYQPQIGVDIDTIMGSYNGQGLGDGLINIGPSPNDSGGPGRLMMYGLPGTLGDSSAGLLNVGSNFDFRNLDITAMLGFKPQNPIFGHFRSMKFNDLLLLPTGNGFSLPRIYWQKQGGFDSSYYTTLLPDERLRHGYAGTFDEINPPYHARLESDTCEDLVMFYTYYPRVISTFFRGGANLFHPGDTISPNDTLFFDTIPNFPSSGYRTFQGDFRGTERECLVIMDRKSNLLCYPNDSAFALESFMRALKQDTLFASWSDPWLQHGAPGDPGYFGTQHCICRMRNGTPQSLVFAFDSAILSPGEVGEARIIEGNASFGSSSLTLESALTIHAPEFFDGGNFRMSGWGLSLADCGDMTGSGDHVLGVEGNFGEDESFYTFYVLGNSFDEKVDMYVQMGDYGGVSSMDSATLDGDRLQDVVIGTPSLPSLIENGLQARGSLLFIHGTDKIPHKLASVIREEEAHPKHQGDPFSVSQSADGSTMLIHAWHGVFLHSTATLYDLLGRSIGSWEETSPKIDWRISIPSHPAGAYVLAVTTDDKVFTYNVAMLK